MAFHPYVGATPPCSGKAQAGSKNLQMVALQALDAAFDYGIYNCRPMTSDASQQSIHSDGRAGDVGFPDPVTGAIGSKVLRPHPEGFVLAALLRTHAWELGIMGIIWNRTRWSARTPWGAPYTGPSPHIDHVHWEQEPKIAVTLTAATAYDLLMASDFTGAEVDILKELAAQGRFLVDSAKAIKAPGPTTQKVGTPQSLLHVLEVHRLVAAEAGVDGDDHLLIKAALLGQ